MLEFSLKLEALESTCKLDDVVTKGL